MQRTRPDDQRGNAVILYVCCSRHKQRAEASAEGSTVGFSRRGWAGGGRGRGEGKARLSHKCLPTSSQRREWWITLPNNEFRYMGAVVPLPVDRHKLAPRRSAAKHGRVLFLWREPQVGGGGGGGLIPIIGMACGWSLQLDATAIAVCTFFPSLFFVLQHLPQGVSCVIF